MKYCVTSLDELDDYIGHEFWGKELREIEKLHPVRVSKYYLGLIDWDDHDDPIRKMAVPSLGELSAGGTYDTSGEAENTKLCGLQHKYRETALILATNRCATYCRHCFRKRMIGVSNKEVVERFEESAEYVRSHTEINNVLISGGDPLVLPTPVIENLLRELSDIDHLTFIRFGSRTPVTYPARFDDKDLLRVLRQYSRPDRRIYIVTQFNHPREINGKSMEAVRKIIDSGVILNNQTVLLKGVNDNPETLAELQNKLVSIGVNPYYVFQCRPVKRVKEQFQLPLYLGVEIVEKAKALCNGHSKRFKYIMSHRSGKIEILGIMNDDIYFKYHQAKDRSNLGKVFKHKINKEAGWLDDLVHEAVANR